MNCCLHSEVLHNISDKTQFFHQVGINDSASLASESVGKSTDFVSGFANVQMVGDPVHEVGKDVSTGNGNQFS